MKKWNIKPKKSWLWIIFWGLYAIFFPLVEKYVPQSGYWVTDTAIDAKIPFVSSFAIIYVSWYGFLFLFGIYYIIKDDLSFSRFMSFIAISFSLTLLFDFLVPNGQNLRPDINTLGSNLGDEILRWLWKTDTNTNVFPSMHVLGTIAGLLTIPGNKTLKQLKFSIPLIIWGVLIILSTMFIKQHAFLDVLGAIIFSIPLYFLIYFVMYRRGGKE